MPKPTFGPIESYAYYEEFVTPNGVKYSVVSRRPEAEVNRNWKLDALRRHRQKLQELRRRHPLRRKFAVPPATQTPVTA